MNWFARWRLRRIERRIERLRRRAHALRHRINVAAVGRVPSARAAERERRLAICATCPVLTKAGVCDKDKGGCGCYMPAKTWFKDAACPLTPPKW